MAGQRKKPRARKGARTSDVRIRARRDVGISLCVSSRKAASPACSTGRASALCPHFPNGSVSNPGPLPGRARANTSRLSWTGHNTGHSHRNVIRGAAASTSHDPSITPHHSGSVRAPSTSQPRLASRKTSIRPLHRHAPPPA
jgi:hypothetical protein